MSSHLGAPRAASVATRPVRPQWRRYPVCVVSSEEKADLCRAMGAELIIDRKAEDYRFWKDDNTQDPKEWQRFGKRIRELTGGEDPDIVFETSRRETLGRPPMWPARAARSSRAHRPLATCTSTTTATCG